MLPIQPVTSAYEIKYLKEPSSINNREYRLDPGHQVEHNNPR